VPAASYDYDVLVIGSGFGGSVAALRLTEKGYRMGVLEAGRRFEDADFPSTSWKARSFFWAPKLGCTGIQRIHLQRNVIILAGAGVGGGSLVYAKNTLVKNYLYLAERAGATVHPETTAVAVRPSGRAGYAVDTVRTGAWRGSRTSRTFTAEHVMFAAGTWGTQQLLHRMRVQGTLPRISARLGVLTRTNSEALGGALATMRNGKKHDFTRGVAITSSIHPDERTHIELVRYGKGSNAMGLLSTLMTDGGGRLPRGAKWLASVARHPGQLVSLYAGINHWSERAVIGLTMQTLDNSITVYPTRTRIGRIKLTSRQGHGTPNPTWIPAANEAMRLIAAKIGGFPLSSIGEMADIPMTAHFIGGCVIGDGADSGVVDPYHRMYGHPGLHVIDGSAISANLGVNPALTITAQAERAMALWPNRGEADPRPAHGAAYRRLTR
jgi:cholesterol oxidase